MPTDFDALRRLWCEEPQRVLLVASWRSVCPAVARAIEDTYPNASVFQQVAGVALDETEAAQEFDIIVFICRERSDIDPLRRYCRAIFGGYTRARLVLVASEKMRTSVSSLLRRSDEMCSYLSIAPGDDEVARSVLSEMERSRQQWEQRRSRVFVSHGHGLFFQSVESFLTELELDPVRLTSGNGTTVIEAFIDRANGVEFAVAALTADDVALASSGDAVSRARQNVIFELGYFAAHLGRERVAAISEENVEIPSNWLGTFMGQLGGNWREWMVARLQAAGIAVALE